MGDSDGACMKCIDDLNSCSTVQQVKDLLNGQKLDSYILQHTLRRPRWFYLEHVFIGGVAHGLSSIIQEYIVDYEILFDESQKPKNRLVDVEGLTRFNCAGFASLDRCGDTIQIYLWLEQEEGVQRIKECKWIGMGCPVCLASASIMSQWLLGKSVKEVTSQYATFKEAMVEDGLTTDVVDEFLIFIPLRQNPLKVTCTLVPWVALITGLRKLK